MAKVFSGSYAGERVGWRRGFNSAADLRTLRKLAGMTQVELGQATGFHAQAVKYWEAVKGRRIDGHAPEAFRKALEAKGYAAPAPGAPPAALPPAPPEPKICGAKNRRGSACQCKPVPGSRRCKFHGGLSTGPKTAAGRDRIAEAQRRRFASPARDRRLERPKEDDWGWPARQ